MSRGVPSAAGCIPHGARVRSTAGRVCVCGREAVGVEDPSVEPVDVGNKVESWIGVCIREAGGAGSEAAGQQVVPADALAASDCRAPSMSRICASSASERPVLSVRCSTPPWESRRMGVPSDGEEALPP